MRKTPITGTSDPHALPPNSNEAARQTRLARFQAAYAAPDAPPWDSGLVPPEVRAVVEGPAPLPPGRALDVGCGTGTSAVYLARHGWQVTGVDWVAAAVEQARARAASLAAGSGAARFLQGDVTAPDFLADHPPVDLWLDVGCLHGLPAEGQVLYAGHAARLVRPGGRLVLYCWGRHTREDGTVSGLDPDDLVALFAPALTLIGQVQSRDSVDQTRPTGWYTFERAERDRGMR